MTEGVFHAMKLDYTGPERRTNERRSYGSDRRITVGERTYARTIADIAIASGKSEDDFVKNILVAAKKDFCREIYRERKRIHDAR